jgi:hypothetical protein
LSGIFRQEPLRSRPDHGLGSVRQP